MPPTTAQGFIISVHHVTFNCQPDVYVDHLSSNSQLHFDEHLSPCVGK